MTRSTGTSGLIFCGSPPARFIAAPHRREIDDAGDAGEILQDDSAGCEGDLCFLNMACVVGAKCFQVILIDDVVVEVAETGFKEDLDRIGKGVYRAKGLEGVQPVDGLFAQRGGEGGLRVERIECGHGMSK